MKFNFLINSKGHIRLRESSDLEFKQSFHFESIPFYLRSLVGMANNRGGQIIFGIKDSPHVPEGLKNDKFSACDPKIITEKMRDFFSPEFDWYFETIEYNGKQFGQMWVPEAVVKPIICKKNNDKCKLRESAIYYRYRGETREIGYTELKKLIDGEKEKEKKLWMEHVLKISTFGPQNIHILDSINGRLDIGKESVLLDKSLLSKIRFIKEGSFVEKEGAPALVLKGEISGLIEHDRIVSSDDVYPFLTKDLLEETGLNQYELKCLLWKLKIKGDKRYHNSIKTGRKSEVHKYSKIVPDMLRRFKLKEGYLKAACNDYKVGNPVKKRKTPK